MTALFLHERWRIITFMRFIGASFFLCTMLMLRMFWIAQERNVKRHKIEVTGNSGKSRQLNIFFITDIHRRKVDQRLLNKIDGDIDIVIIGGDLAERNVPLSRISENVKKLSQLGQVFFVWGNNDREVEEEEIRKIMQEENAIILDNENQPIPNHLAWGISGTDDPSWRMANPEKALQNMAGYSHSLFVSHQPVVWRKAESFFKPTLMLSGHTHGGQIRLGKFGISEKGYFKWQAGRGKLISNGYGTTKVPLRFGAHPESHLIKIRYHE